MKGFFGVQVFGLLSSTSFMAHALLTPAPFPAAKALRPTGVTPMVDFLGSNKLSRENGGQNSFKSERPASWLPMAAEDPSGESKSSNLPFWLDIGTKGGAVFWSLVLFIVPIIGYNIVTGVLGYDEIEAGKWIGVGFTAVVMLAWSSTYLFRVATKDMTYAKQLKDYENAVIAKRLEELDDDEIQALVEEIERDEF